MVFKQIYLFLFLILTSFIVLDAEICSFETSCACSYCGEDGNFTKCNYINLFCEEGENYFTNQFKEYKEKRKHKQLQFFGKFQTFLIRILQ